MTIQEFIARQNEIERTLKGNPLPKPLSRLHQPDAALMDLPDSDPAHSLARLGIYTPQALAEAVESEARQPYLIEGLFRSRSLNLLVGDSGLGKTPLAIQIGLCVAAGVPLFGKHVERGRVLYCDAESSRHEFSNTLHTISRFLGVSAPPENFLAWSPNWEGDHGDGLGWFSPGMALLDRAKAVQPSLVIVDALRTFWPNAESKNPEAAETFRALRKLKSVTWLVLHHRRKVSQLAGVVDLASDPQMWFQETAGALALINQSDTRCGVVPPTSGRADLLLAGFIRNSGPMTPLHLARATDGEGNPIGYSVLMGAEHLNTSDRTVFDALPMRFRFKQALEHMGGTSDSNVARFLKRCIALEIVRKDEAEYVKVNPQVERVE